MLEIRRWNAAVGRVVACATARLALLALAGAAWDRTPPTAQKRAATWFRGGF
jgi:hypothetical protein